MWQRRGPSWERIGRGGNNRVCPTCTCVGNCNEHLLKIEYRAKYFMQPPKYQNT